MDLSGEQNAQARSGQSAEAGERKMVLLFCLLAAIHVFVFSAAFPLFNINDEPKHYDLVLKYSHGELPRGLEPMSDEWMPYFAAFATQEYFYPPEFFPGKQYPPPLWTQPMEDAGSVLSSREQGWKTLNHESSQPPLYYALAGGWLRLGHACGFKNGYLLYWVRFLNLILVAGLVWLGYATAQLVFPERWLLRVGVPALLAFIPQTVFYSVTNDILSPVCFGMVFISLAWWWRADPPKIQHGVALGAALAATFLTKLCNQPMIGVAMIFLVLNVCYMAKAGKIRAAGWPLVWLALCAGIPMAGWMIWCRRHFGDFTGSETKIQLLGWTHKPMAEWFSHPIFRPQGLWTFVFGLLATFWRGEFLWHRQPLASTAVDPIYVALSLGLVGAALVNLLRRPGGATESQRQALWFCFWSVLATAAFLGFLSVIYDFHDCFYPSREHPYFTSGRLLLGALIPFLLLVLYGLDCALDLVKSNWARPLALVGMILFMLISEVAIDWPVFFSQFNWFHL